MKITLKQLVDSLDALKELFHKELPVLISFDVGILIEDLEKKMEHFDVARNGLITKMGEKQKDGTYKVKDEDIPAFEVEMNTLLEKEVEIRAELITVGELGEINMKPVNMRLLNWLIVK